MATGYKTEIRRGDKRLMIGEEEVLASAADLNRSVGLIASGADINNVATPLARIYSMTESGPVPPGKLMIELNHISTVIAATIADAASHMGMPLIIKNTSASGTAAHTVTLTAGTWNGTNKIATFNAPAKLLEVIFDSAGNGTVLVNSGTVTFSGT